MNDPYKVLGVSQNASDKEIKKAYRDLARKYHPDNYHDNPLSDLAQEKMKEINDAYNTITRMREGGADFTPGGGSGSYSGSADGMRVRAAIQAGNLRLAQELLDKFPSRNAEWNFLMGCLCYKKNWLEDARRHFQAAVDMEPNNPEYRQALNKMNRGGGYAYRPTGYGRTVEHHSGCDLCDCCMAMLCLNMCCRCAL